MPNKKIIISIIFIVILAGTAAGILWDLGLLGNTERRLWNRIKDRPDLVELFQQAQATEEKIKAEPDKAEYYLVLGLQWKSIAELHDGDRAFFKQSLQAYEHGIEQFGEKNIVFYLNGGSLAERLDDFAKAEEYFRSAIAVSPADESGYLDLVDLYYYKLKKPKEEILAVFAAGMEKMVNPTPLIAGRATYLRRLDDYAGALEDYKILAKIFPDHPGYKEIIAELEGKLGESGK